MSKFIDRTGETNTNTQQLNMRILKCNNARDLDIIFDDGTIVKRKYYRSFINGQILNPNYHRLPNRVGETNQNSQGLDMVISSYRKYNDIDVKFAVDNFEVKNTSYNRFLEGEVRNLNYPHVFFKDRTGETSTSNDGELMKIIAYRGKDDIDVEFIDNGYVSKGKSYYCFKLGKIDNPYFKTHYGVGYLGEGDLHLSNYGGKENIRLIWSHMIQRAYDKDYHLKRPSCINNTVCEEWLNFCNFAIWYDENIYYIDDEKMHVDKDILVKGNRHYSPETCLILPSQINQMFNISKGKRGNCPIGVSYIEYNNNYQVFLSKKHKPVYYGVFSTPEEAFEKYKVEREKYNFDVATYYKDNYPQFPKRAYDAIVNYRVEITD